MDDIAMWMKHIQASTDQIWIGKIVFFSNKSLEEHLWWCHYTEFMLCGYNCLLKQRNIPKFSSIVF